MDVFTRKKRISVCICGRDLEIKTWSEAGICSVKCDRLVAEQSCLFNLLNRSESSFSLSPHRRSKLSRSLSHVLGFLTFLKSNTVKCGFVFLIVTFSLYVRPVVQPLSSAV